MQILGIAIPALASGAGIAALGRTLGGRWPGLFFLSGAVAAVLADLLGRVLLTDAALQTLANPAWSEQTIRLIISLTPYVVWGGLTALLVALLMRARPHRALVAVAAGIAAYLVYPWTKPVVFEGSGMLANSIGDAAAGAILFGLQGLAVGAAFGALLAFVLAERPADAG